MGFPRLNPGDYARRLCKQEEVVHGPVTFLALTPHIPATGFGDYDLPFESFNFSYTVQGMLYNCG